MGGNNKKWVAAARNGSSATSASTRADPASTTVTSTARQLNLSRLLVDELKETGLTDAILDEHGYAMATLPATVKREVPAIARLANVDVAPDAGTGMGGRDRSVLISARSLSCKGPSPILSKVLHDFSVYSARRAERRPLGNQNRH